MIICIQLVMPFTFMSILIYSTKKIQIYKPLRLFTPLLLLARHWSLPRFRKIGFYKKKGRDTTVVCPSCGFQSSDRVSTPRLVRSSTCRYSPAITTYFSMVSPVCTRWTFEENHPGGAPQHIPSSNSGHNPILTNNLYWGCLLLYCIEHQTVLREVTK